MDQKSRCARSRFETSAAAGLLSLALLLGVPEAAHAKGQEKTAGEALKELDALYEDLDYEKALEEIKLARQGPRSKREEMLLSLYEGILLCETGRQSQAEMAFRSALLVRQDVALPVVVAPKIDHVFEVMRQRVKAELASLPPSARSEKPASSPPPPTAAPVNQEPVPALDPSSSGGAPSQVGDERKLQRPKSYGVKPAPVVYSRCRPSVYTACNQLMKKLLHIQEQFLRTKPPEELPPVRELVTTGQQIRSAQTLQELKDASENLDYWQALYSQLYASEPD